MNFRLEISNDMKLGLIARLQQAYQKWELRLVKRLHALLYLADDYSLAEVSQILEICEQTIRNYVKTFLLKGLESLKYRRPPGRPAKLSKAQKKELGDLLDDGPEKAGYDCGCWTTALIQDLIRTRFEREYTPNYIAELLKNMGFSYQRARFVSDHLGDVAATQKEWMEVTWPKTLAMARERKAMLLFGDEASFAQWGSLSYTWARRGKQPTVPTSGTRRAYKVFGLVDFFSGALFSQGITGKFNSDSYQAFLDEVLKQTQGHLVLIQDGARYHTSKAMQEFFAKHVDRLTVVPLPAYSPDFNPIEYLWRNLKKQATHLRYFPTYEDLTKKVDEKLRYFAELPQSILGLMGKYCHSLGSEADS
jgi:transposase